MEKIVLKIEAVNKSLDFYAKDSVRYHLEGMFIERKDGKMTIVATDSQKMYVAEYEDSQNEGEFSLILKPLFKKPIKAPTTETILTRTGNKYLDAFGNVWEVIDAEYPNYRVVIPNDKTPQASQFCMFSLDTMKVMDKYGLNKYRDRARQNDYLDPVKFVETWNGITETYVFMPLR